MNNLHNTKLHKIVEEITLSPAEKSAMKAAVLSYMERNPVKTESPFMSFFESFSLMINRQTQVYAGAAFAIVFVITGTAYAAEGTLPGDFLYPIKVQVNEEIEAQFARTPQAKAVLATELAKRRIVEVKQLAATGNLNPALEAEASVRLKEHAHEIARNIETVKHDSPQEAFALASQAEATILAQAETLARIDQSEIVEMKLAAQTDTEDVSDITNAIAEALADIEPAQLAGIEDPQVSADILASVETQADKEFGEARELFDNNRMAFSDAVRAEIDRRFEDIVRDKEEGNEPVADAAANAAVMMTMSLEVPTAKTQAGFDPLMRGRQRLQSSALLKTVIEDILELGIDVPIEEIIPKELTADEWVQLAESLRVEAVDARARLVATGSAKTQAGLTQTIADIDTNIAEGDTLLNAGMSKDAADRFRIAIDIELNAERMLEESRTKPEVKGASTSEEETIDSNVETKVRNGVNLHILR